MKVFKAGGRIAVDACGAILAKLGALSVANPADADVVLASSDLDPLPEYPRPEAQIVCDITAYGSSGPMRGVAHPDGLIQAVSGLAETTGEPDGPPTLCGLAVTEGIAALYAAAAVLVAMQARRRTGAGQDIEIALYDCAYSTLTTFLPFHFIGKPVSRSGNRHVLSSPWNIYRGSDGWLIVCTGSDDQWQRLCRVIGRADLADDPALAKSQQRVARRDFVDASVQVWLAQHTVRNAAQALEAQGIACGPIVPAAELLAEPNIAHRGLLPDPPFRFVTPVANAGAPPAATAWPGEGGISETLPLAGLKVLEIGQYTTAPFIARHLGALGASVVKIEPPGGDPTRAWAPQQDGQSHFFSMSNSDKRSLCLDLRDAADKELFSSLVAGADVLVENLKPGALERFGLGGAELARLNPRLVYCAVSGFGAVSAYPGRPAFDTVIQAMSGIMDLTRVGGVPQKNGISLADAIGGLFGLIGTLSALSSRDEEPQSRHIDISMQDAAAWLTQWPAAAQVSILKCRDGYVAAATVPATTPDALDAATLSRAEAVDRFHRRNIPAASVLSIGEVAEHPQTLARHLLESVRDSAGRQWRLFTCPMRLKSTPPVIRNAIGKLGEANGAIGGKFSA